QFAGKSLAFVFKIASRCNLDCSYCYVYNKGDNTWQDRPVVMRDDVVEAALGRIEAWCEATGQRRVRITFHGGEPLLAGRALVDRWCRRIRERLAGTARVDFNLQTNATLIDDDWAELFVEHRIEIGVSIDGPAEIHDAARVDRRGAGSHERVVSGIDCLRRHGVGMGALAVVQFGADSVSIHRHITSLGFRTMNYLLPDFTHDTVAEVRRAHGPTPCADYLLPVFDEWWVNDPVSTRIPLFVAVSRLVLGGRSNIDMVGNEPFGFVFIEPDGAVEDLDALRVCRHGMAGTGLNVFANDVSDVGALSSLHRAAMFDGLPVPTGCQTCPEATTCSGGYLPHRWSSNAAFDNPSVWCADLLALFAHVRKRLDVDIEETALRRQALAEMTRVVV
ncbi:radical SAM protein, partial [Frankia sp. CcWB2]